MAASSTNDTANGIDNPIESSCDVESGDSTESLSNDILPQFPERLEGTARSVEGKLIKLLH